MADYINNTSYDTGHGIYIFPENQWYFINENITDYTSGCTGDASHNNGHPEWITHIKCFLNTDDVEQSLEGTLWCVTGSFEHFNPRSKAMDEIEKRGGRTGSSVTGKTTHLLAGKGGGSKLQEAMRLGVRIVDEEEFISMLGSSDDEKDDQEKGQLELF